jgi:hypothetical protein
MRVIKEFPFSDSIKASVFTWNGKYILKLECGGLEQSYKISELEISGEAELMEYCRNPKFINRVLQVFSMMEDTWPPEA